jgi:sensor histidine kinase YesM
MSFGMVLGLELSQILTYVPLAPFVFALANRFPVQKDNWPRRSVLHLGFALIFSTLHTALRGITPYGYWDMKAGHFASAIWNSQTHTFHIAWPALGRLFLLNVVDDITGTYALIVLVAHALSYYKRVRDGELHSAKLEMELTRSHLQALKSNLQPHFLFNTMHSISALMLTDVGAADRMMTRLSDLLRMSLESQAVQITTLNRELEFVSGYLEIEKIRFAGKLKIVEDIAPETLDAQVPHLLLQPLVENAIRHGISRLLATGTIWISSRREGNKLEIRVRDNGPGLDELANAPRGTGLGLRAARERLLTLYGRQQDLEIHNVSGGGVEVCVRLPFLEETIPVGKMLIEPAVHPNRATASF